MESNRLRRALTCIEKKSLCGLADPVSGCPELSLVRACEPVILFDAIHHHGIEPVALRKLKSVQTELSAEFTNKFVEIEERQFLVNALSMTLENHASNIFAAMKAENLKGITVKGPVFAQHLYARLNDRPFTDIDILVPHKDLEAIGVLMQNLGYRQFLFENGDKSHTNMEQKWVREDSASLLIEVHTNLVHYPNLRRCISFGYADYMLASQNGDCPAVGFFLTAVIHAAAGNKFSELKLLVDVAQAFRHMRERDFAVLNRVLEELPAHMEVLMCLDLIGALFENLPVKDALSHLARRSQYALARKLVTRDMVLNTYFDRWQISRARRNSFRFLQNRRPRL